ncbi:hypothetical protein J1614_010168 [Plenodomus biglobosus]|nr:hypothetical protein J1614_010168 [Plenodomus biglobosus]
MAAIILLYSQLKNEPVVKGGTFLTWANILGKVSSAALIVPTSEALGQLKWNWFHSLQAMWDFEIFDKASRGPLGALMLLYRTKGRSLAVLGALLILLLLAIDTFFQQVVDLPDHWALQTNGDEFIARDHDLSYVLDEFAFSNGTQPVPFGAGMRPEIPLSCPTSNCTWPLYETLGFCSQCIDISSLLNFACMNTKVDWTSNTQGAYGMVLPNATMCGYFLNVSSPNPIMMSGYITDVVSGISAVGEALLTRILPLVTLYEREPSYGNGSSTSKSFAIQY